MDKQYADTVRLLLNIAPEVFDNDIFAMKGELGLPWASVTAQLISRT
ncbi:hypothetical protein UCMB321_1483 [Pseudomonas batumici]|uniref:Uncharacterized protein n=1 Tax=Pseudomonas batumici TaxID=226910 RepID=A0A0C2F175_9PSED|nr:hypothetical protein UCMB321_1483 [Pseudomonas batumici]